MPVGFENFRDTVVKEFFKNYDNIKNKLVELERSEYNNKEYSSRFFGMQCVMNYKQISTYFENEYKYLLNDYENILAQEEEQNNNSGSSETPVNPEEELPLKDGVIYLDGPKAKRKCPYDLAACYHVGDTEEGQDGKIWEVKLRTNGVKYWKRVKVVD